MHKQGHNIGEWSELYVLSKLLADGKLYITDENLTKLEDVFYEINEINVSGETNAKIIYKIINSDAISVIDPHTGEEAIIYRKTIRNKISAFLKEIISDTNNHKAVGNELGIILKTKTLSATSKHKSDLIIRSYDPRVRSVIQSGYSIKSELGSAPTLFNASQATNLIYQIVGLEGSSIQTANMEGSCRKRILKIYELGGRLRFIKTENKVFKENLIRVDGYFNHLLAAALIIFYTTDNRSLIDVIKEIRSLEVNDFEPENLPFFINLNFKKFLFYSALGMVAKTPWDGILSSLGGVIVVKKDGEIVGYTPYNINLFQEYLFTKTKFDSPDSGRNKYGKIYKEDSEYKIKLNFQIRFID